MLLRYNIVTEREPADALVRADACLSTQPTKAEREQGQSRDIHAEGGANSSTGLEGVGSPGRIRSEERPPTPDDSSPLDPDSEGT
jgi:hypothetical protein